MACPFYAGSMITDRRYFVGRREELNLITSRMTAAQPTSINFVSKYRMGKSSLLYHFCQTYEERVRRAGKNPQNYVVIYLSLQNSSCQQEKDFYQAVAQELLQRPIVQANPALVTPLNGASLDRQGFSDAIKAWQKEKVLPVLCLDKVEELLENKQEFNDYFYDNLRSLIDGNGLMLIISSRETLEKYSKQHQLTSDFFNVFNTKVLTKLTEGEAMDLVRLPDNNNPALSEERQKLSLQWGERNPYLLQLAGRCLWDAQEQNRPDSWAKEQFDLARRGVLQSFSWRKLFHWLFWPSMKLGQLARFTSSNVNDFKDRVTGSLIIVAVILVIVKVLPYKDLVKLVKDIVGIGE